MRFALPQCQWRPTVPTSTKDSPTTTSSDGTQKVGNLDFHLHLSVKMFLFPYWSEWCQQKNAKAENSNKTQGHVKKCKNVQLSKASHSSVWSIENHITRKIWKRKKGKSIDANTEVTEILWLFDKNFIAAIIKMFQKEIKNTLEANGNIGSLGEEIATVRMT